MTEPQMITIHFEGPEIADVAKAAELRQLSIAEYVKQVVRSHSRGELSQARGNVITLTPREQLAFWKALNETPILTEAQEKLGRTMRGDD